MTYRTVIRRRHAILAATLVLTLAGARYVPAQGIHAVITSPANGATNVDISQPIQWTSVANVQAYYLYIGTTVGAKDLVDTLETQQTSYVAPKLPGGQTVYARMWTKMGGLWSYSDSTFTTAPVARLTYPTDGAVNANLAQPIQWTTVADVQTYYLYVGTTVGAKDLVNTGEIQQTSYLATGLPSGQTLYARMWTRAGNIWRYADTTFTAASSAPVTATLTYPANGATNANMALPIQWTSVPNIQAYYLYLGTTVGANDLVNTGETQQTSYLAVGLPAGSTLYARMWAKVGGVWRYVDSTFTAGSSVPVTATLTFPSNGYVNANMQQPIQWTTVANVQAYYLYVGTTVGASELINTGEIQTTSYQTSGLPIGQTLYARIWAKVGNVWRYKDSTFSVAVAVPLAATMIYPANGVTDVDLYNTVAVTWNSVANVQAYYLYIGTTPGAKDIVNSGEVQQTHYPPPSLVPGQIPSGQTLYTRIWTKVAGVWRYTDSTFTTTQQSTLLYPSNGGNNIDQASFARWTPVTGADSYYLYVGSSVGANNYINSGEVQVTSLSISGLPAGPTLYARLWTKMGSDWRYRDSTFTAAPLAPQFIYPLDGSVGIDGSHPFQWTPPLNAALQRLIVGTSPGASDVFDSGAYGLTGSPVSLSVPGLPTGTTLYARVLTNRHPGGSWTWWYSDVAFTLDASVPSSTIVAPADGEAAFDSVLPFEWSEVPLARGYRLKIGTTPGANDLHDSGVIHVTRRFVPGLPTGTLFGRVESRVSGQWQASDFTFTVAANTASAAVQIQNAFWATDVVRRMALADNLQFGWTELADVVAERLGYDALCSDYAETLLRVLTEMNIQLPTRRLDIRFNANAYDAHTLAEIFDTDAQSWVLLDPTFDLTARRTGDNEWATAEDVSVAMHNEQWGDITYEFLSPLGDFFARNYYLDYPLLFNEVRHPGDSWTGPGPVLPYLESVAMPLAGAYDYYVIGCGGDGTATVAIDGVESVVDCSGVDGISKVFGASQIAPTGQTSPSVTAYRPRRNVF